MLNPTFKRVTIIVLVLVLGATFNGAAYAYFDDISETSNETLLIGEWDTGTCTLIYTAQEFYDFATSSTSVSTDEHCLANDIDFAGFTWIYLESFNSNVFRGTFNGNNHTLSNITMTSTATSTAYLSLFSTINGATIKNVTIETYKMGIDSTFYNTVDIEAGIFAGPISGTSNFFDNITILDADVIANTLNGAGGLVAQAAADSEITITNIKVRELTVLNESKRAGGLVSRAIKGNGVIILENIDFQGELSANNVVSYTGSLIATVQNMTVSASNVVAEYSSTGSIDLTDATISYTTNKYVGGFFGNTQNSSIITLEDCFYTGELYGNTAYMGSVLGRKKTDITMNEVYYSKVWFDTSYVNPWSTQAINGIEVNTDTMPNNTWWNTFSDDFSSLWAQDIDGRLYLIRLNL